MQIALIGYGKMGKEIAKILKNRNFKDPLIFDKDNLPTVEKLANCHVAIEFTEPKFALQNIEICAKAGVAIIVGTTGWYQQYNQAVSIIEKYQTALLTATNFSIGVNITFFINKVLAKVMQAQNYKANITEIHHTQKMDAPSGTAITLAETILNENKTLANWVLQSTEISDNTLPIIAIREDEVPGTHTVLYTSKVDSIELKHTAHSRIGFAEGAVEAAIWLANKKGVYKIEDMLNFEAYLKN